MNCLVLDKVDELDNVNLNNYHYLIKSPSVPLKIFEKYQNIKIISDLELLYLLKPNLFYVTITGTNAKTTTISFLHQLLIKYHIKHFYAGNMGIPLFSIIDELNEEDIILIEASSYMLEATYKFKPNIYTITNLSSNHLDHHQTKEQYFNSKLQIIERLKDNDMYIKDNYIDINENILTEYTSFDKINLKVAITNLFYILQHLKIPFNYDNLKEKVKSLKKEQFRYQIIYKDQNLKIINDSKSTNPTSGLIALKEALLEKENIILIMGGKNTYHDYQILYPYLSKINKIYLYGENKDLLYKEFIKYNKNIKKRKSIDNIIKFLNYDKGIILFSPMSQSFDQYHNFIERGQAFNKLILKIVYN